jgi:hypothetical protein
VLRTVFVATHSLLLFNWPWMREKWRVYRTLFNVILAVEYVCNGHPVRMCGVVAARATHCNTGSRRCSQGQVVAG